MTRRELLGTAVTFTALLAALATAVPLLGSLKPSARAGTGLPELDISNLGPGSVKRWAPSGKRNGWTEEYLVLKDYDSRLYVYALPVSDQVVILPDYPGWGRWGGTCENFGPEMSGPKIKPGGLLRCLDPDRPDLEGRADFLWTYAGKNLGNYPDMEGPPYKIEAGYLVLWKH